MELSAIPFTHFSIVLQGFSKTQYVQCSSPFLPPPPNLETGRKVAPPAWGPVSGGPRGVTPTESIVTAVTALGQ